MYIIVSHLLKTNEISHRASYSTRVQARKNLLKEAQAWIVENKPNNEWQVVEHKNQVSDKLTYFVKTSSKTSDSIKVYQRISTVEKGWVYNTPKVTFSKLLTLSIIDISDVDGTVERHVVERALVPVKELTESAHQRIELMAELEHNLAKRREVIE